MAFPGGNIILATDLGPKVYYAGIASVALAAIAISRVAGKSSPSEDVAKLGGNQPNLIKSLLLFAYGCFFKPHRGDGTGTQQDALESFYKTQAGVYDATRKVLLKGREDMLALVAAQLQYKEDVDGKKAKRVWVDVGGGTGWNIEAMSAVVDVSTYFSAVYLVDFSPSLCEVARQRFARLGWNNVKVICEDARKFRLEDHENEYNGALTPPRSASTYFTQARPESGGADLITMSYSLSMMPDYYSIIDSLTSLLSPHGIMGVIDFYVQSKTDYDFRNYTGGVIGRHVNYFSRTFWRAWFEIDRVGLEAGRRDYLEYRFGTLLTLNSRNNTLGSIPYYVWVGCHKKPFASSSLPHEIVDYVDSLVTESPYLRPVNAPAALTRAVQRTAPEIRSKAFDAAVSNLSGNLPLPSFFYQNHHWRIYYDDQLKKHTQFNGEYIYAFTWEDSRVDARLLDLKEDDVVLAICSAGDNILSYAAQSPAKIHAVDLNPSQCHLLELKVAAYNALDYDDFWKLFGEGKHQHFRRLLVEKLSPHLSSRAFQYWLVNENVFTNTRKLGLYDTGGSRHAIRVFRWISRVFGLRRAIKTLLNCKTLNEQREIYHSRIRPALLSRFVNNLIVSQESFLWSALGVPKNQLSMIEADHITSVTSGLGGKRAKAVRSHAIWHYMVNTLDPVIDGSHVAADNPYYYVCLTGQFSPRCHPDYLSPQAHAKLSRKGAFDGLRIHTDEIDEVVARFSPGTLTVAVVMDSMDWFDPPLSKSSSSSSTTSFIGSSADSTPAARQINRLNRALKMGGRVLLRSSALKPWYIAEFEARGFVAKCHGTRSPGSLIDRVNMYASCWICTKVGNLMPATPEWESLSASGIGELRI